MGNSDFKESEKITFSSEGLSIRMENSKTYTDLESRLVKSLQTNLSQNTYYENVEIGVIKGQGSSYVVDINLEWL